MLHIVSFLITFVTIIIQILARNNKNIQFNSDSIWAKTIPYKGKNLLAIRALKSISEDLPSMVMADGIKVDHFKELKDLYERGGIKAINFYVMHVKKTFDRNYRQFKIRRFWSNIWISLGLKKKPATA